jgi:hypothetical protein
VEIYPDYHFNSDTDMLAYYKDSNTDKIGFVMAAIWNEERKEYSFYEA